MGKTLTAISHLGAKQSTQLWCPSLTKDMQIEQLLCWSGMTDTEHSATSRLNEEEELTNYQHFKLYSTITTGTNKLCFILVV